LIVVQATLTGILAILIAINAIINCCKENPHRKRRKAAEKMQTNDLEGDAFLLDKRDNGTQGHAKDLSGSTLGYDDMRAQAKANRSSRYGLQRAESQDPLVDPSQVSLSKKGGYHSVSQHAVDYTPNMTPQQSYSDIGRQPRLPDLDFSPPRIGGQPGRHY